MRKAQAAGAVLRPVTDRDANFSYLLSVLLADRSTLYTPSPGGLAGTVRTSWQASVPPKITYGRGLGPRGDDYASGRSRVYASPQGTTSALRQAGWRRIGLLERVSDKASSSELIRLLQLRLRLNAEVLS